MIPSTSLSTANAPTFNFGGTSKPGGIQFGSGLNVAGSTLQTTSSIANPTPIFSTANPTTTAPLLAAPTPAVSATPISTTTKPTTVGFSFPTTTSATTEPSKGLASLTTSTTTTPSITASNVNQLNFCQLEEYNNKWIVKLEDQEKMFINHATEINSWDKILNINNNKIIELSQAVEKVKIEQQVLEQELEVIAAHHAELDECITPLQKELAKLPHSDIEKAQTYILAESLDTQLRQMSKDLKEVIEHLNETNKIQDANDPIVQIGQILNAHVSSMHWIETTVSQVANKIDEISKMYDSISRDNERSLRLAYNN